MPPKKLDLQTFIKILNEYYNLEKSVATYNGKEDIFRKNWDYFKNIFG